ncbi:MAG: crotonobetaine/carnitine-CoA ligase [Granulosicoccus sp.]
MFQDSVALAMNLSELITDRATKFGDKEFLLFERQPIKAEGLGSFHQSLTYRQFETGVDRACHFLCAQGLKQGDVCNLHLPNCIAFLILWFAAARIGAVMMPTNTLASVDELTYLLGHSESRIAFTTAEYLSTMEQCQSQLTGLDTIVLCDPYSIEPATDSFESQLSEYPVSPWKCSACDTDTVAIMYTSGTTSKPKGVMVSHANYLAAGGTVADAIELKQDDRQFVVLPLFHGNAQYYSTMSALLRGASIALMDRFSASQYFDKCIEYGCTVASLFAAPMRMILAQPRVPEHCDNRLRIVIYAQNLTCQQLKDWQQRFDAPLSQLWGMTETMGPPLMNPLRGERRNWTVGKPIGDYEIALVNELGEAVASGQEGEIVVKGVPGKTLMAGYFKNPRATIDTLRNGWLYTGDNAIQDGEGYYRFVDRKKDMIKRSGENISAGEVENAVMQHPAVFECAVIGLPDALRDEAIVAVVVLNAGQHMTGSELIDFCAGKLAKFRVPSQVVFEESLPKTSVGKIQKHLILKELMPG